MNLFRFDVSVFKTGGLDLGKQLFGIGLGGVCPDLDPIEFWSFGFG